MVLGAVVEILSFRQVVEIEYTNFHESWLKDGKPVGGPKSRKAASFWRSGFSTHNLLNTWLFQTPGWAKQSPDAMRHIARGRVGAAMMFLGVVILGVVIAVTTFAP
jgi:type VI protein secretion system component VasK